MTVTRQDTQHPSNKRMSDAPYNTIPPGTETNIVWFTWFMVCLFLVNLIVGAIGAYFGLQPGRHDIQGLGIGSAVGALFPPIGLIFGPICISRRHR